MKLLFDQNLSFKLCQRLASIYPGSVQVREIGMDQTGDLEIWNYARTQGFTIVTQDGDFSDLSLMRGWPPKVVWLRCGNQPTNFIKALLTTHAAAIFEFCYDPTFGVLEIP